MHSALEMDVLEGSSGLSYFLDLTALMLLDDLLQQSVSSNLKMWHYTGTSAPAPGSLVRASFPFYVRHPFRSQNFLSGSEILDA